MKRSRNRDSSIPYARLEEEAERCVRLSIGALPDPLREQALAVPVEFAPRPHPDWMDDETDEDLLGLFVGEAFPDQGDSLDPIPARIFLFLENIIEYSDGNLKAFRKEVKKTYLHELGHFIGYDEDDLFLRNMD